MVIVLSVLQCLLYLFVQTEGWQQIIIIIIFSLSYYHYINCEDDDGLQFGANTSPYPEDPHWVHRENNRNPPRQELRLEGYQWTRTRKRLPRHGFPIMQQKEEF